MKTLKHIADRNADAALPIIMKAVFVFVCVFTVLLLDVFVNWYAAVVAFFSFMYAYGYVRPYLVGPPSQQDYDDLYRLFFSRDWAELDGVVRTPATIRQRTLNYAEMLEAIPDITSRQLEDASENRKNEVDSWRREIELWISKRGKYDEMFAVRRSSQIAKKVD